MDKGRETAKEAGMRSQRSRRRMGNWNARGWGREGFREIVVKYV